jgi:hypothetical protein
MERIQTPTRELNKHGLGRDGFTDGNDQTGTPSTQLEALWFDRTQEEICRVIELTTGMPPLDPDDHEQLSQAIDLRIRDATAGGPHGQCYLAYTSANTITLQPFNGHNIISGGVKYQLPPAGLPAGNSNVYVNDIPNQNLIGNGEYYVSFNGVQGILKYWSINTYSHAPDTTVGNVGIEVLTLGGVPLTDETLVALVYMIPAVGFGPQGLTLSWFNPTDIVLVGVPTANAVTESTGAAVDAGPPYQVQFSCWSRYANSFTIGGGASNDTANGGANWFVGIDGAVVGQGVGWNASIATSVPNETSNGVAGAEMVLSDGFHTASAMVQRGAGGGTATFNIAVHVRLKG